MSQFILQDIYSLSIIINILKNKIRHQQMLTSEIQQQIRLNIKSDNFCLYQNTQPISVEGAHYQKLMNWVLDHLNELRVSKITKYLTKIYIEVYLLSKSEISLNKLQLLGITAIILAIKFNESFNYSFTMAVQNSGDQYTISQIINFQQELLTCLNFKLKYTTPFCYIKIIKELVPYANQRIFNDLEGLIQYVCLFKQFINIPSTQIFYGTFYYLCKKYDTLAICNLVLALSRNKSMTIEISNQINKKLMLELFTDQDSTMQIEQ